MNLDAFLSGYAPDSDLKKTASVTRNGIRFVSKSTLFEGARKNPSELFLRDPREEKGLVDGLLRAIGKGPADDIPSLNQAVLEDMSDPRVKGVAVDAANTVFMADRHPGFVKLLPKELREPVEIGQRRNTLAHEAFHVKNPLLGRSELLAHIYGGYKGPKNASTQERLKSALREAKRYLTGFIESDPEHYPESLFNNPLVRALNKRLGN